MGNQIESIEEEEKVKMHTVYEYVKIANTDYRKGQLLFPDKTENLPVWYNRRGEEGQKRTCVTHGRLSVVQMVREGQILQKEISDVDFKRYNFKIIAQEE